MPYLQTIFGTGAGTAELMKGYKDITGLYTGKFADLSEAEKRSIPIAEKEVLQESIAVDLAASAESASALNLYRLTAGSKLGRFYRWGTNAATHMFRKAEEINRRAVFLAAHRLAMQQPGKDAVLYTQRRFGKLYNELLAQGFTSEEARAHLFATETVRDTMYEYASWARPKILGGFGRAIFPFYNFILKSLFFIRHSPGGYRYLAILFLLTGMSGLPGGDDWLALSKAAARLAGKDFDPERELRELLHEFDRDNKVFWPEVGLNGLASQLPWDIGTRLSLGRIIPGAQSLLQIAQGGGDFYEAVGRFGADAGGAFFNIPMNVIKGFQQEGATADSAL
ncbi:MAG: hypothetical protein HC801_11600 [Nitrospira sp.]|nr:hypothetical protein [Nitrospira sp.]